MCITCNRIAVTRSQKGQFGVDTLTLHMSMFDVFTETYESEQLVDEAGFLSQVCSLLNCIKNKFSQVSLPVKSACENRLELMSLFWDENSISQEH